MKIDPSVAGSEWFTAVVTVLFESSRWRGSVQRRNHVLGPFQTADEAESAARTYAPKKGAARSYIVNHCTATGRRGAFGEDVVDVDVDRMDWCPGQRPGAAA